MIEEVGLEGGVGFSSQYGNELTQAEGTLEVLPKPVCLPLITSSFAAFHLQRSSHTNLDESHTEG